MGEPVRLPPELVEEVFFRLPPDEPACLARASAVCKPWRRILADLGFRRRYRKFHGAPPVLGLFGHGNWLSGSPFDPIPSLFPAQPDRPGLFAVDCRHGRVLFADAQRTSDLIVLDPVTDHQRRVPLPHNKGRFSAAVLCAAQGCDHHNCQQGHFFVVIVTTDQQHSITSGWLYSSETRVWRELTPVHHPNVRYTRNSRTPSVLVGDALYFDIGVILECQLGTLRLSMFDKPIDRGGRLMTVEEGRLGFAAEDDVTNLTLWLWETGPVGAIGWAKLRVIDLKTLLPAIEFAIRTWASAFVISGVAEGTQDIFVRARVGSYMVNLKSGQVRPVYASDLKNIPYVSFYIPAMEVACTGQEEQ